jgi:hypothetical protein
MCWPKAAPPMLGIQLGLSIHGGLCTWARHILAHSTLLVNLLNHPACDPSTRPSKRQPPARNDRSRDQETTMNCPKPESDVEIGRVRDGYPSVARWIAQDPDDDPLLFRRFGRHSARILLHLQCRLVALEKEIDELDEQARTSEDLDTRRSLQRWEKRWRAPGDATVV